MFIASDVAPRWRKGWGKAKGHEIAKDDKIALKFDYARGTWKALGDYGPWFDSAIDIHTRDICKSYHNTRKDVDPQHKRNIQDRLLVYAMLYCYKSLFKLYIIKPLTILTVL